MYEAFYGFKEKPFSMLPDPSFLFLSKKHRAALTLLEYGLMNQVGFCVLSGEPGTGKTTILRALLNRVDDNVTVGLISNTHQSFGGLLDWILSVFDLHKANLTQVEMHQIFVDFLIDEYANNRRVLLIVDEAQNMDPDSLEELRMLSNVNTEKDQLLQVVLAGQPKLKENLRKPELMQFAQRIAVDYHLHSLNLTETCGYIQHRLVVAGAERDVFTPEACERIHCYSGGSPRLINLLCETVLVYGFADDKELIDAALVEEMVHERMEDSVVPLVNCGGDKKASVKNNEQLVKDFPWIRPEGGTKGLKPEVKAQLEQAQKAKREKSSGVTASSTPIAPLSAQQPTESELPLADDLISQAEVLGDAAVQQANEVVPDINLAPADTASVDLKKDAAQTKATQTKDKVDVNKNSSKPKSVVSGSTQESDALAKEMFAKNQIEEAAPKKNSILKYGIYAGIIALGLAVVALFFSDYTRDSSVFDASKRFIDGVQEKNYQEPDEKDLGESKLGSGYDSNSDVTAVGTVENEAEEKLEQEKVEQEKLEQKKQARLAKEKEVKAEEDRLEKEKLAREQVAKEQAEKEQAKKEQAAKVRKREANDKRKIAEQIRQREAELEAKAEARRLQLERAKLEKAKREQKEVEKKIQREQEAKRLEQEWLKEQRESLRATEESMKKIVPDDGFVSESKKKAPTNCVGPAAKFKAICR